MNTLVQGYLAPTNDFQLNYHSKSLFPEEENHVFGPKTNHLFDEFPLLPNDESSISKDFSFPTSESSPDSIYEGEESLDDPDATLKFISQMLMEEEDLVNKPCMLHDCLALQATEKSLYDVLNNHPDDDENADSPNNHFTKTFSTGCYVEPNSNPNPDGDFESLVRHDTLLPNLQPFGSVYEPTKNIVDYRPMVEISDNMREKRNRSREEEGESHKSTKQLAHNVIESESLEMYDKVLLCSNSWGNEATKQNGNSKGSKKGRPKGGGGSKKQSNSIKEMVDLRSLLTQCAQAVASYDTRTVNGLLIRIRQHSSPSGDGTERVAHYFANALEARMAGTGPASYVGCFSSRISASEILKSYKAYINACPFQKISNLLANKTIKKLADGATTLHIIDFGILYGFQWPCLIQALSERPGGPPKVKITGIDFPQPGFRPAERVEDTGNRLQRYCERFGVPFEYIAIAQKWETIKMEQLKIEKNELLVVNSLYRLQNVPDETVMVNSPRDAVLNLIKKINPNMFIQGVINGTYNTPFFITRFREALFHFSSMFDMFEATMPREDEDRVLFEREVVGKDAMNIIACEGTERVDRPETYKQWQYRNLRAGLRQLPLDQELVKSVRRMVKMNYHKDFSVDEDGKWMLQGWKGRVIHALSYWQPDQK
ncbi:hypothetical protein RD792_010299 [Penstemon davidsonii]|uniref:Uncharacterized protein n=1 Tax=Penstemon davidsonii TaxID=160366 RepID=A0ABR0D1G7_9LAMI|nr:hypothetical protein RD792_010299 [Penstemon davidsonii]